MHALRDQPHTWTFDDLQQLPADADWRRYEIVDGALVVSPPPGLDHEYIGARLRPMIEAALDTGSVLLTTPGIDLGTSYRVPDLVVAPAGLFGTGRKLLLPSDALLVVEVVSPGSRTTDRITKPAQYAAAGIIGYWRVETEPDISLTAYALDDDASVYTELGTWGPGQVAEIERPFAVRVDLDALVPGR